MSKILIVNPPVYDFALYDFWLKPYGALRILSFLNTSKRHQIRFFDFLDRFSPLVKSYGYRYLDEYGRGKFIGEKVKSPNVLAFVKRKYRRFGISHCHYEELLSSYKPDFVLITTGMTYWYQGISEVIMSTKYILGRDVYIIAGGILATLLPDFIKKLGADLVVTHNAFEKLSEILELNMTYGDITPHWSPYKELPYIVIRLTEGCPFRCPYCASYILKPQFRILDIEKVVSEVVYHYENGVKNFAFYDDALLVRKKDAFFPFLQKIMDKKIPIRFHTPNALHARFIDEETALLMKKAGFETIYLGFETSNEEKQRQLGGKVYTYEFDRAVRNLLRVGFKRENMTAYIFMGLLDQDEKEVKEALYHVNEMGIKAMLSEYSPIPGTVLGEIGLKRFKIKDLLLTNCSVFPLLSMGEETVKRLKSLKNRLNENIPK